MAAGAVKIHDDNLFSLSAIDVGMGIAGTLHVGGLVKTNAFWESPVDPLAFIQSTECSVTKIGQNDTNYWRSLLPFVHDVHQFSH